MFYLIPKKTNKKKPIKSNLSIKNNAIVYL